MYQTMRLLNNKKTFIIAEAGVNHNGNFNLAKKLIKLAKKAGADAVKFQIYNTEKLVPKNLSTASYQKKNSKISNQYDLLKKLELTQNQHIKLKDFSKKNGIIYLASAFDLESLSFVQKLKLPIIKIPSGEVENIPYLKIISKLNKPVLLSTGLSKFSEIVNIVKILYSFGLKKKNLYILHCNSSYPSKFSDVNLNSINYLKKYFKSTVGYSDHSLGIEIPIAAVSLGAKIIEKHLTINTRMNGPDHSASLEFKDFKKMVDCIRNIEKSFGSKFKPISKAANKNLKVLRKYIFASKTINRGELFSENNLEILRGSGGVPALNWLKIINKRSKNKIAKGQKINKEFIC